MDGPGGDSNHPTISRRDIISAGLGAVLSSSLIPGTLFARDNRTADTDLEVAIKAANWIRRQRTETPTGAVWALAPGLPKPAVVSLYHGIPGVVLFHIELFHTTGDKRWLDEARLGANELISQMAFLEGPKLFGFYDGLAGIVFVLEELHRATGDGRYRDAATRGLNMLVSNAQRNAGGASWGGSAAVNDVMSGSAGIGLTLLWAHKAVEHPASRDLAIAVGKQLMQDGVAAHGGTKWGLSGKGPMFYPNFSHGTSGVAYFLAMLARETGDKDFLAAARSGAKYLEAVADSPNKNFRVFHHEPGGEYLFYVSWCHGPAGTSRLFEALEPLGDAAKWRTLVDRSARAVVASGAPEKHSPGYWNNISRCCGNVGVGEYFLRLQRTRPAKEHSAMIDRVKANTLSRATVEGDGLKWTQAENRVSPDAVYSQTGYMQGAAGVGAYFLHCDALAKGKKQAIQWPDAPA